MQGFARLLRSMDTKQTPTDAKQDGGMNMTKRISLVLMLLACVLLLCACQSNENEGKRFDVVTNANGFQSAQTQQQAAPVQRPIITAEPVAAAPVIVAGTQNNTANQGLSTRPTAAPTMTSVYAGATPVVIDPIDKPTPTPLPSLHFENEVYDATKVHLSFKAPAGWIVNDTASDTFMITNPASNVDYAASLTIRVSTVSQQLNANEMKTEVKNMMSTLRTAFTTFNPSSTASRTLLDKDGVYANYTATLADGTKVAGRVHVTCIGRTMYMLHVSYPQGYTETYKEVLYDAFRHSVKITQ